ncbi:lytic murein transglycosylase [Sulfitobacter litoralis]|uniref:lytic murein transglycosylase n=1 Tax=Sulfitobacter litoralis TaxID=335975 RepID=UPI002B2763B7|nr:lytic murein transglycosylase [Sulfitobacter litoralis]
MKLLTIAVLATGVTLTVGPVTGLLAQTDSAARPAVAAQETGSDAGLQDWLTAFRARALAAGIDGAVFDRAMQTVRYDTEVIRRDRNQSEFTKTIWDYLETATSDLRIANGKKALAEQADALAQIEKRYGVEKEIITAIWGLESAYGTFRGSDPVLTSLATLAYDGRRRAFFEGELLDALRILRAGDTTPSQMQGSWAGAMGHTQFMPSSFQLYAEDFTADGKRDIWGDDPRDALASTAAYLKHFGWVSGQPWGVEVQLPDGFDYLLAGRDILKTAEEWTALGVAPVTGVLADHGPASLLLPGGAEGAAFLIYTNFAVIERYNSADAYVIGVGHLADRIAGGGPIEASWPVQDRALSYDERIELQTRLTAQGFDTVKIDAKIGPLTISAVRAFQLSQELLPDGYASLRLLQALRSAAGE